MRTTRLIVVAVAFFTFYALPDGLHPDFAPISVAYAEAEGPALKLKKAAKLHASPSGSSKVLEIAYENDIGIWLDKVGPWVQLRMKMNGRVGWIHHSYLKAASIEVTVNNNP